MGLRSKISQALMQLLVAYTWASCNANTASRAATLSAVARFWSRRRFSALMASSTGSAGPGQAVTGINLNFGNDSCPLHLTKAIGCDTSEVICRRTRRGDAAADDALAALGLAANLAAADSRKDTRASGGESWRKSDSTGPGPREKGRMDPLNACNVSRVLWLLQKLCPCICNRVYIYIRPSTGLYVCGQHTPTSRHVRVHVAVHVAVHVRDHVKDMAHNKPK